MEQAKDCVSQYCPSVGQGFQTMLFKCSPFKIDSGSLTIIFPILVLASFNHVAWHWSLPGGMESVVVISMAGVVFRKTQLTTVTVISRDIKETFHDWNVSLPGSHSNQEECFRSAVQLPHLYPCHGWTNWAHLARLSCKWFYSSRQEAVTKRVSPALQTSAWTWWG